MNESSYFDQDVQSILNSHPNVHLEITFPDLS